MHLGVCTVATPQHKPADGLEQLGTIVLPRAVSIVRGHIFQDYFTGYSNSFPIFFHKKKKRKKERKKEKEE